MVMIPVWAGVVDPVTVHDGVRDEVGEVETETLWVTVGVNMGEWVGEIDIEELIV